MFHTPHCAESGIGVLVSMVVTLSSHQFSHQLSGHMAGLRLLENPAIDGFVGPYSYAPTTRNFSRPLLPAGEFSSLWLRQRLWVVEDDSRTHLAAGDPVYGGHPLKFCFSLRDTVDLLRFRWGLLCALSASWVQAELAHCNVPAALRLHV